MLSNIFKRCKVCIASYLFEYEEIGWLKVSKNVGVQGFSYHICWLLLVGS